ncbi:MAG TPA: hypothetical protein VLJ80_08100 [Solirubrobacteraceae bacterium]|nr:hypothetical protein [Solirubrobacteraceae bacterium]
MSRKGSIVVESRLVGALTALVGLLAIGAAPAVARWSAPRTVSSSRAGFGKAALATDARGDAAFASASESDVGPVQTRAALNVALLSTRGPSVKRTLWRNGDALVGDVVVALDARGELTVAWIAAARGRNGETVAPHTIRSAYRTPSGRWSPTEIVGHSGPFLSADLRLAVAPNGEMLATWRAHTKRAPGVAAAWRKPGHRFGPETAVSRAKSATMTDPTSLFDSSGAAHIYGTVGCGRLIRSCATMVSTAPHSHRFGTPLLIAPAPAEFPVVSFSAPGRALIVWEAGDYQDLEPSFAAPYARVMTSGSLSPPAALQPGSADTATSSVNAVAANDGGGTLSWSARPRTYPGPGHTMLAVGDTSGHFAAPSVSPDGLMPVLRDGVGDVLLKLGWIGGSGGLPPSPLAMQPAGGGVVQSSPMPLPPSASLAAVVTTQPVGAGAAAAWVAGAKLEISTWQP